MAASSSSSSKVAIGSAAPTACSCLSGHETVAVLADLRQCLVAVANVRGRLAALVKENVRLAALHHLGADGRDE